MYQLQVFAEEQVRAAVAIVVVAEAQRSVEREGRVVVVVDVELDAPAAAGPRLIDGQLDQRAPEPAAARALEHEQVLEQAVLRRPPDAVAEAQLRDAGRRCVLAG